MTEKEILEQFVHAKERLDQIREAQKIAQEEFEKVETLLVQSLNEREAKATAKYEGLGFASLAKPRVYASFDKSKERDVFDFIERQGEKEIVKLSVNPQTLNGFVGRMLESGVGVPDFITYFLKQGLRYYARD